MDLCSSIPATQEALGGVCRATVYNLVKAGRLELRKIGRRSVITNRSIRALVTPEAA